MPPSEVSPPVNAIAQIVSMPTPPDVVARIEPTPSPAPPAVVAVRSDIATVCPTQAAPEMPRKAIQDGIEGVVKAQIRIKGGVIQDVIIVSGARIFHAAVKAAVMQYKCISNAGGEVVATQEFTFKLE